MRGVISKFNAALNRTITGSWMFNSDLTLNGSGNTAPNQTAATAAHLINRGLGDTRYGGPVLFAHATDTPTKTNDAVLADDAILVLNLTPGIWLLSWSFRVVPSAATGSQLRLNVTNGPGGESNLRGSGFHPNGGGYQETSNWLNNTTTRTGTGVHVSSMPNFIFPTPNHSPTIAVQWCQNISGAAGVSRNPGGFLLARKLA